MRVIFYFMAIRNSYQTPMILLSHINWQFYSFCGEIFLITSESATRYAQLDFFIFVWRDFGFLACIYIGGILMILAGFLAILHKIWCNYFSLRNTLNLSGWLHWEVSLLGISVATGCGHRIYKQNGLIHIISGKKCLLEIVKTYCRNC